MRSVTLLPCIAVLLTCSATASAQEDAPARFRGGAGISTGAFIVPGLPTLGTVGFDGQLGVQVGRLGVFLAPSVGLLFGRSPTTGIDAGEGGGLGGVSAGGALMVDYMLGPRLSLGLGPEAHIFLIGGGVYPWSNDENIAAGGALLGGRLSLRGYPIVTTSPSGRRHALAIGVDLRVLEGTGFQTGPTDGPGSNKLVLSPVLTLGYQSF